MGWKTNVPDQGRSGGVRAIGLCPMHKRPTAGSWLTVLMRDGRQLECRATMVIVADRAGIIIYHGRKAIDESQANGWWPTAPNEELDGAAIRRVRARNERC